MSDGRPHALDLFRLNGRTALITGGARGLGLVMAEALAEAGASVCLTSRTPGAAQDAAASLASTTGGRVVGVTSELTTSAAVEHLSRQVADAVGHVDILVNNAGINIRGNIGEISEADWDAVMDANLKAPFLVARAFGPAMCARGWGRVITLSSMLGTIALPGRSPYASSKAAVLGLTRVLALEWAPGRDRQRDLPRPLRHRDESPAVERSGEIPGVRPETAARPLGRVARGQGDCPVPCLGRFVVHDRHGARARRRLDRPVSGLVRARRADNASMWIGHVCLAAACVVAAAIDSPTNAQGVATAPRVAVPAPLDLSRYEKDVVAFEEADRTARPPAGGILFVGSSIFRQWTNLAAQMAPLPVFNRAFGGSRTAEQLHYMDRIVLPYKPRVIVYYCGSNDVNANESAADIASRYEAFSERVRQALPDTRLYFASIIRAPQKRDRWSVVDDANARVREYSARTPGRGYIDLHPALEETPRQPRMDLYLPDHLHYLPPAYDRIVELIRPVITAAWAEVSTDGASRRQ